MAGKTKKSNRVKTAKLPIIKEKITLSGSWNPKFHMIAIFAFAFCLYANTLSHDYTQDDAIVIYDNMFTQQGIQGIPGILKYDTFYGFFKEEGKAKLVSGGRYRPFTLIMFALEWEIFGRNPFISHLINIILYGFLGIVLYKLLSLLFKLKRDDKTKIAFVVLTTLLYISHPIHTEAVANIKGRDEILSMLGSLLALWAILKYHDGSSRKYLFLSVISFFIALMSKENAITFLAIIPLSFMLFRRQSVINALKRSIPLFLSAIAFLAVRFSVLGMDFGGTPNELMNNPFLKLVKNSYVDFSLQEKIATIILSLGKYIQLLLFPHPLSHDYYPRAIDIMSFADWQVWISLLLYIILIVCIFYFWKRDRVISYGAAFFLISLSIVSNIVFPIGTNMSERFVFMPSLGILLIIARLMSKYIPNLKLLTILSGIILLSMSAKTIDRNKIWKDDYTLFTTDVKNNQKSAKLLNAAGGALTTNATKLPQGIKKTNDLRQAIVYLDKAVKIHPAYRNAYLLLGNAHYYLQDFENSILNFDRSLSIDPQFQDALKNLPIVLRDGGRHMGQKMNNFAKAEEWLLRSFQMNPGDYETCRLLGITFGIQGQDARAIEYFQKAITLSPDIAANYSSLGTAYLNIGDKEKAREAFNKAVELDPQALQHLKN